MVVKAEVYRRVHFYFTYTVICLFILISSGIAKDKDTSLKSPVYCAYAPPGEYMKDHTLIFHDGWWHLYAISGTAGYCHAYTGNEETFSWSISRDLVNWEFRGHVLHASLRANTFDQHEVWAPYCIRADNRFYLFYSGIVHPVRPMCYERKGHDHVFVWDGHRETQGLAVSEDLTSWEKIADPEKGLDIRGRDSNIIRDEENSRWLLYSTGPCEGNFCQAYVSQSTDLINWEFIGVCALFPAPDAVQKYSTSESLTVMKHPVSGKWIMLANFHYVLSDNPVNFKDGEVRLYDTDYEGQKVDIGFAGEIIKHDYTWYRSGCFGPRDYWKLGFTEIEWVPDGAFIITGKSTISTMH